MKKEALFSKNTVFKKGSASGHFPVTEVNMALVDILKKEIMDYLYDLDNWILFADREHLPIIAEIPKVLKKYYKDEKISLYRGFSTNTVQEDMGLELNGWLFKSLKAAVGSKHKTKLKTPVSFSITKSVSEAFGKNVIQTPPLSLLEETVIPLTKEICYIISEIRNLDTTEVVETQDECILLPPKKLDFTLISKAGLSSIDW